MRLKWVLTIASLKMYLRQREAIIWNLLLPLFMVVLFGLVRFDGIGHIELGVVDESGGRADSFVAALKNVKTLHVHEGLLGSELKDLEKGEREIVLVVSRSFEATPGDSLTAYSSEEKPREAQLGALVVQGVLDERTFAKSPSLQRPLLRMFPVKSRNLTYIDFLLPGILSMSIMQMGVFGVAFGFVTLKKRGILRRLWVTPINPNDFIIAQVVTRVLVLMVQMTLMIVVGIVFFHLHFIGNLWNLFLTAMLGAVVFLSMGFALAGFSRSEDQVAPLANIITLPMMLLSGVFFSRTNLPEVVRTITDFFPLTYLADGMRSIAIDGATLAQVTPQLIGLLAWSVISCFLAVKLFRWE